jgi:2-oxoglutarate dehydrogenase complex dehydrogenase (E1) component-like enzyme
LGPRISFVLDWLKSENKIKTSSLDVYSRKVSASPAVGKKKKHDEEQAVLLKDLFV